MAQKQNRVLNGAKNDIRNLYVYRTRLKLESIKGIKKQTNLLYSKTKIGLRE